MAHIVANLPPVKCFIRKEFLYNFEKGHGELEPCWWFSIKSLRGQSFRIESYLNNYGALYDKFVGFVENLDKVGRNIDQAKTSFTDAYKQLYTGNDNLVRQTEKLKKLGIKNKKEIPQSLVDNSENNLVEEQFL